MTISEQGRSELTQVADEIAYNFQDRDRLIDSFMQIVDKYEIPKNVARKVLEDALKKRGLAEWTIRRALPDQLKQKQSPSPTRQETRKENHDNITSEPEQIAGVSTEDNSEESPVTPIPFETNSSSSSSEPEPEPEVEVEEETIKKQERQRYENEMTELCQRVEILTNDNRELKKALADKTAFQAASQITPRQDLVSENKSLRQEIQELNQELEALKQQKTLQLQPQPLELEMDTFWDTFVILFLPKNRGKTLKIIHDGSRVQQVTMWKSDKQLAGVKNSK